MINAIIFDFDGVIVDSERLHWAAFNAVMEPRGKTIAWPEYIEIYIGFDDRDAFRCAFPDIENPPRPSLHSGHPSTGGDSNQSPPAEGCPQGGEGLSLDQLIAEKAAAFQELLADGGAAALPGAVELIKYLSGKLPIAICSGALREDIVPIIGKLGVADAFDTIVTAEDTHISKPNPAPYSKAWNQLAGRFNLQASDIALGVAIEDTPAGIASAKGAGLKVLAVTNSYDRSHLTQADVVIDSLEGLTLEKLNELF